MRIRKIIISGPAEADLVWQRLTDFDLWPTWSPQILRVESTDERVSLGARGTVRALAGVQIRFTITEYDNAARSWSWIVRLGSLSATMSHRVVTPERLRRTARSEVHFTIETHPGLAAAYLPAAAVALRRLVG